MPITGLGGLSGLVSGLDTKTLIDQLMQLEAQPLYQMKQRQHVQDLKKGLYLEINNALLNLKSKIEALTRSETINKKSITAADNTVAAASITDSSQAVIGQYDISITNLATAFDWRSDAQASATAALNLSGSFTLQIDDGSGNIVQSQAINVQTTDSLNTIASRINSALDSSGNPMKISATVVDTTLIIKSTETGSK